MAINMNPKRRALRFAMAALCATAGATKAMSSTEASGNASVSVTQQGADAEQLQEVIVTAQKRESTVQSTPISITALTGQALQERGITDIASIVESVPGVSMRTSGPGQTELEMRGMSSAGGNSSTVGFYLDDTPLTAPASAQNGKVVIDPNLYDLNRIEVLRGPQGTLYGSGSMGGTIKLVPNAPDPTAFDASGEAIFGHTDGGNSLNHTENAMVNLPFSDTMALRLVGSQEYLSGWIDRKVIAYPDFPPPINGTTRGNVGAAPVAADFRDVNDERLTSARAALLWKPTDRLSITPSFLYQEITQDGLSLIDSQPGTDTQYQPYNSPEPFKDRIDIASLSVQYHFDVADLTSTTSHWTRDEQWREDGTEELATALGVSVYPSEGGAGQNYPTTLEDDKSQQYSEEIRLTSSGDTAFKWLGGYFYQYFTSDWDLYAYTPYSAIPGTITNALTQVQKTQILQQSFFGEASYKFLSNLTGTVGLRRYYYHAPVNTVLSGWVSPSGTDAKTYYSTVERDSGVTPKFNLSYQFDKDLLVYGTASQGFRPGGGNTAIPTTGPIGANCLANLQSFGLSSAPLGFKPDKVWSYELGEKFESANGRVTINSAGYFENWQHIQQNVPLACGFPFTGNAGDAHIYGAEMELNALLLHGLTGSVNAGWTHARYIANSVPSTTIGERVQNVPGMTLSASLAYRHNITDSLGLIGRIDNNYIASRIDTTAQANYLPPYDMTNIRAGVEGDKWTAVLFVNNVTNRRALLTNSPAVTINVPTFNRTAVALPLTFGIDLTYKIGR
jgi:iron complex outermembrane receptor protein